jgi:FlaA1/EpsC-like NDP-sugar epimerase
MQAGRRGWARTLLPLAHDALAAAAAWILAYLFRLNFELTPPHDRGLAITLPWVVPLQMAVFWGFGLYRGMWRYASLPDLRRIVIAAAAAVLVTTIVIYMLRLPVVVPRSVLLLDPILLVMIMGGSRLGYRMWREHRLYGPLQLAGKPVLILGAGEAAAGLVKELSRSPEWRVVGLLDDNPAKVGQQLQGVKVLGPCGALPEIAPRLGVEHAIIAMPSQSHTVRRRAAELCASAGVRALTVPSFEDLVSGRVMVSAIRQVELDDLLGRDPVELDDQGLHQLLTGRTVLVTGAGGSIGAELCRQIARFQPAKLVMFELNEFGLYQVEQEFSEAHPGLSMVWAIGDAKNPGRVGQIFREHRPSVVFHAAAYKHVPLMEVGNAWEAVTNNVLGTYVVARAAIAHGVEKFVLVSTDKAVNPTNVMGASKRLAEMVCQALQGSLSPNPSPDGGGGRGEGGTRFVMVRFGNVLGSAGSVIPKFREQIARGGPVTVTHPEITRYFMSIPEATQLVLQAGLMGRGGEIFVLDMGEPVRIADLARDLIRLSGFSEEEVKITYTGLRPGEKLYEELLADDETTRPTPHPKLRVARARPADPGWLSGVLEWLSRPAAGDDEVRRELARWVPEYDPPDAARG